MAIAPGNRNRAGCGAQVHHGYNAGALSRVFKPDDVLSYMEMCSTIGVNLQRRMNFRLRDAGSIILMSLRPGAPYADQVEDDGRTLIYEGHDIPKTINGPTPKTWVSSIAIVEDP